MVRMAYIGRRYFLEGTSKVDLAHELGISRFKVARMIERALETGMVTITIGAPGPIDIDLSMKLREAFGLRRAIVVVAPNEEPDIIRHALGRVAARLLEEIVVEGDVVGLTAGRTLSLMGGYLSGLAFCEAVQLTGVAGSTMEHGIEVVRRVSQVCGGPSHSIFAPLFIQDEMAAEALRKDPIIQETFDRFPSVNKAMVAIGSWNPADSQLHDNAQNIGTLRYLLDAHVSGDVCATLVDNQGNVIDAASHTIAIPTEELRRIPDVIGVAGGVHKTEAVRSVLMSGLIQSLVTDSFLAKRLLEMPRA